jgi:hypothetical protein
MCYESFFKTSRLENSIFQAEIGEKFSPNLMKWGEPDAIFFVDVHRYKIYLISSSYVKIIAFLRKAL